jgi:choline-phosphate cytidylyltransferase
MRRISQRVKDRRIKVGHAFKNARALRLPSSILPKDVEKGVKELAQGVESLVDKVVSGQLGFEMVDNMDKLITGFIGGFEKRYSKLERVIKTTLGINKRGGVGGLKALAVKNGRVTKRRK